jgi:hypothetical protein
MVNRCFLLVLTGFLASISAQAQVAYPGIAPGKALEAQKQNGSFTLENKVLQFNLAVTGSKITVAGFNDKQGHEQLKLNMPVFELSLANGSTLSSDVFSLTTKPLVVASQAGKKMTADLINSKPGIKVHWEVSLANGDNFVKQTFTFSATDSVNVTKITLIKLPLLAGLKQVGKVDGSPLVRHNVFFAVEHPMSQVFNYNGDITIALQRSAALRPGNPLTLSAVFGVTPAGQLRRGFLYYTERIRANPYHQVLHYNSWFDLSWADRKLNETECLDRIKVFSDSLISKRMVKMDAFLFDDGWDDNKSLWQFNTGFPNGFTKLTQATQAVNAGLGVWISPWGGYDEPKLQRLTFGRQQVPAFETNENGFSLTGPVYNKRFRAVTTAFIKNYNVAMFKFDGVGAGNGANGASITYQKDIEAFLSLITGLREEKPDLYLSLTVGTWPSVYWLKYGDAIWRAGDDTGLAGDGPKRQQWITYKDGQAYKNIVKRAPLFPLNSLMYHGICIAENGLPGKLEMDNKNIADEIWAFFGTGTSLQELYVNPHMLNSDDWDCIRAAANWSEANKQALADVHWIGGDPLKGQVYGYAGWATAKGVITLRNPTAQAQVFKVKVKQALNVPGKAAGNYSFYDAKSAGHNQVYSGTVFIVKLAPYEVKVMDVKSW